MFLSVHCRPGLSPEGQRPSQVDELSEAFPAPMGAGGCGQTGPAQKWQSRFPHQKGLPGAGQTDREGRGSPPCWAKGETVVLGPAVPREVSGSHPSPQVSSLELPGHALTLTPWTEPSRALEVAPPCKVGLVAGRAVLSVGLWAQWQDCACDRCPGLSVFHRASSWAAVPATAGAQDAPTCVRLGECACVGMRERVHLCGHVRAWGTGCVCGREEARTHLVHEWPGLLSGSRDPPPGRSWHGRGTLGVSLMEALLPAFTPVSSRPPRCSPAPAYSRGN